VCTASPARPRRTIAAAPSRRPPRRAAPVAPEAHRRVRRPLAVVMVQSPHRLVHPSAFPAVRRRSPSRRRRPCAAPAARFCPGLLDLKPTAHIRLKPYRSTSLPVNPKPCARNRSWPPDLDPMDQIHPFSITPRFCLRNPGFFQNCNSVLPP
jgi:hypothetical protein